MSTPATPVSTITDGLSGVGDDMLAIAGVGIGIGVVTLVVRKGFRLVTGFVGR